MTDKTDPSATPGQKRPHATLDLRAVEVKQDSKSGPSDAGKASASTGYQSQPDRTLPPPAPRRGGGFFSHLVASLVGGLIVLLGADKIAPALDRLGLKLPVSAASSATTDLQQRLAVTEAAAKLAAPADQLATAQQRIEKLESSMPVIASLEAAQTKLAEKAAQGIDKSAFDVVTERLSKLEDQLGTMAAAAETSGGGNRIQGLAAVTGKLSDLETSVANKLADLKRGLVVEMEPKLAAISEASEKARTGTERLDREVLALRSDTARLMEQTDVQKADSARLAATVDVVRDKSVTLTSSLNGLKSAVEKQISEADVASAVTPVSEKIAALESSVAEVIKSETERKTSTERVVASLELSNLKRVLDRGEPYAVELAAVTPLLKDKVDFGSLETFKDRGVASAAALQTSFAPLANKIIDASHAPAEGSVIERLMASAKSAVRVRKISQDPDDKSADAIVGRIDAALKLGKLESALSLANGLPAASKVAAADWMSQLDARHSVDAAMTAIDNDLKATLTGAAVPAAPKPDAADTDDKTSH
jgi:hypothetical protein